MCDVYVRMPNPAVNAPPSLRSIRHPTLARNLFSEPRVLPLPCTSTGTAMGPILIQVPPYLI